jgi:hypothetical protein
MKSIIYIALVAGVMAVVLLLGFAGDKFGPFGSVILMLIALVIFVVIGTSSGVTKRKMPAGAVPQETINTWDHAATMAGENWIDLVIDHQEMTRHMSLEIDRSRRFDRTFTVVVIAPDMKSIPTDQVNLSSESELNGLRLFAQEIVVRQLRTTDVISNSVMPAVTIALLPETDSDGTNIAVERIRAALADAKMSIGTGQQTEMKISVMAVNYPTDVRDTLGFVDSIKEFEDRVTSSIEVT